MKHGTYDRLPDASPTRTVTKRANEDGDQSNARKRSRFMRMARKLQKKGFEVTCSAEF